MKRYGIAIDIGTTTITAGLVDIAVKKEIASIIEFNPQAKFGQDIISRIAYSVNNKDGLQRLHNAVINCVSALVEKLINKKGIKKAALKKMVVVGNSAMEHFFLKLSVEGLSKAPYISSLPKGVIEVTGGIYFLPIIKSFVGSDLTAGILYTGIFKENSVCLLIDIGTNGEIALLKDKKIFVASTAAGPAFEATDKGISGSALIEMVSSMLENGTIDKTGRLKDINAALAQNDIRKLQTAKAAIMAGVSALLKKAGLVFKDIKNLYVAGKFGNYIDKEAAVRIGLLPDIDRARIKFVGNAAYKGAIMALCSEEAMKKTIEIAKNAVGVSLFGNKCFKEEFIRRMSFNV